MSAQGTPESNSAVTALGPDGSYFPDPSIYLIGTSEAEVEPGADDNHSEFSANLTPPLPIAIESSSHVPPPPKPIFTEWFESAAELPDSLLLSPNTLALPDIPVVNFNFNIDGDNSNDYNNNNNNNSNSNNALSAPPLSFANSSLPMSQMHIHDIPEISQNPYLIDQPDLMYPNVENLAYTSTGPFGPYVNPSVPPFVPLNLFNNVPSMPQYPSLQVNSLSGVVPNAFYGFPGISSVINKPSNSNNLVSGVVPSLGSDNNNNAKCGSNKSENNNYTQNINNNNNKSRDFGDNYTGAKQDKNRLDSSTVSDNIYTINNNNVASSSLTPVGNDKDIEAIGNDFGININDFMTEINQNLAKENNSSDNNLDNNANKNSADAKESDDEARGQGKSPRKSSKNTEYNELNRKKQDDTMLVVPYQANCATFVIEERKEPWNKVVDEDEREWRQLTNESIVTAWAQNGIICSMSLQHIDFCIDLGTGNEFTETTVSAMRASKMEFEKTVPTQVDNFFANILGGTAIMEPQETLITFPPVEIKQCPMCCNIECLNDTHIHCRIDAANKDDNSSKSNRNENDRQPTKTTNIIVRILAREHHFITIGTIFDKRKFALRFFTIEDGIRYIAWIVSYKTGIPVNKCFEDVLANASSYIQMAEFVSEDYMNVDILKETPELEIHPYGANFDQHLLNSKKQLSLFARAKGLREATITTANMISTANKNHIDSNNLKNELEDMQDIITFAKLNSEISKGRNETGDQLMTDNNNNNYEEYNLEDKETESSDNYYSVTDEYGLSSLPSTKNTLPSTNKSSSSLARFKNSTNKKLAEKEYVKMRKILGRDEEKNKLLVDLRGNRQALIKNAINANVCYSSMTSIAYRDFLSKFSLISLQTIDEISVDPETLLSIYPGELLSTPAYTNQMISSYVETYLKYMNNLTKIHDIVTNFLMKRENVERVLKNYDKKLIQYLRYSGKSSLEQLVKDQNETVKRESLSNSSENVEKLKEMLIAKARNDPRKLTVKEIQILQAFDQYGQTMKQLKVKNAAEIFLLKQLIKTQKEQQ